MEDLDWFSDRHHSPSGCTVRMLHYPALPTDTELDDEVDIRAGAHSDYGSITLLFQRPSQPGLEILTPEETWAPVPVFPVGYKTSTTFPPILVNIADLLSYWTNGLLVSTVHRVIFPKDARKGGEDRYSIVYFGRKCPVCCEMNLHTIRTFLIRVQVADQTAYGPSRSRRRC